MRMAIITELEFWTILGCGILIGSGLGVFVCSLI